MNQKNNYILTTSLIGALLLSGLCSLAHASGTTSNRSGIRFGVSRAMPIALVYQGPGACPEHCSDAAAEMANLAGFETRFVGPNESNRHIFDDAAVWIQPGGVSVTAAQNMDPQLKKNLKAFVGNGGGYVGFCAGAFLATAKIGTSGVDGLGILPGGTELFPSHDEVLILPVTWNQKSRFVYWEGGPFFKVDASHPFEIIATFADGTPAAVRATYKDGRVFVSGPHPEAPQYWRDYFKLTDPDGLDSDLASDMIVWAAGLR